MAIYEFGGAKWNLTDWVKPPECDPVRSQPALNSSQILFAASVENAIASRDSATLERYVRFLGPISDRILARNPGAASAIRAVTPAAFASYVRRSSVCE